jgi:transposase
LEPTAPIDESGSSETPKPAFKPSCGPKCRCRLCTAARKRNKEALDGPARGKSPSPPPADLIPAPPQPLSLAPPTSEADISPEEAQKPLEGNPVFVTTRRSKRDRVAEWVLLRAQGMRTSEIAARMGIKPGTLHTLVSKAAREGWLKFDSPADRLEYELAPLVVDNVRGFLDAKDKQITIEAAKGLGLFKSHQAVKIEDERAPTVIALRIDVTEPASPREGGTIVGTPKHAIIESRPVKVE